jgi:aarF domain-containing kinase
MAFASALRRRPLASALAGAGAALGAYVAADGERRTHVAGTATGLSRFGTTLGYGLLAAWDYKFVLGPAADSLGLKSDAYEALRHEVDLRNARRMLHVCKTQAAFYTKLGQYVSTLDHALPSEYTDTLRELQDRARARP